MKINEQLKEINENNWKPKKTNENRNEFNKINVNQWKSMETQWKINENFEK